MADTATEIEFNVRGISRAAADGRYVRRFVGASLAADSYLGANSSGSENVLANPNGPVIGGLPLNTFTGAFLYEAGDGGRFGGRLKIHRAADFAVLVGQRVNGSLQAPTQVLAAQSVFTIDGRAYDNVGAVVRTLGQIVIRSEENVQSTAHGGSVNINATRLGSATMQAIARFQASNAGAGIQSGQANTYQFVPLSTMQLRNVANTQTWIEWNATGLGFFGSAPIAKPTVTGAKGGNAALTSLLTQLAALGLITDSTT